MGCLLCRIEPSRVSVSATKACEGEAPLRKWLTRSDNSDEILRHAEKKNQTSNPNAPAATAPAPSPASTALRPNAVPIQRGAPPPRPGAGIASTSAPAHPASNLAATYRNNPNLRPSPSPGPIANSRSYQGPPPMRPQNGGYDPRMRGPGPGPGQQGQPQPQPQAQRNAYAAAGRRF